MRESERKRKIQEASWNTYGTTGTAFRLLYNALMAPCKACFDSRRDQIDQQIVGGTPLRTIVAWSGISLGSLSRHRSHVKDIIRARTQDQREEHGTDLLQRVRLLTDEAIGILQTAKAEKNLKAATSAVCAAVRCLELCGRLDGSLAQPHAPGLHLTLNRITNNIVNYDTDAEFARMIGEATNGFSTDKLLEFKRIAQGNDREILVLPVTDRAPQP